MRSYLDRFYDILDRLRRDKRQGLPLTEYGGRSGLPDRGVYFFFEPGEHRNQSNVQRVVRVGTHAVSLNSKSKLWTRLRAHRGTSDGRGNHRGSIFRLHVGAALATASTSATVPNSWGVGSSAVKEIRQMEVLHEQRVSQYIGRMSVVWVAVPDPAGPNSIRSVIERNSIALLSNTLSPVDPPSSAWLGLSSPREEIRRSGLWNLNYVADPCDYSFLELLEQLVVETVCVD